MRTIMISVGDSGDEKATQPRNTSAIHNHIREKKIDIKKCCTISGKSIAPSPMSQTSLTWKREEVQQKKHSIRSIDRAGQMSSEFISCSFDLCLFIHKLWRLEKMGGSNTLPLMVHICDLWVSAFLETHQEFQETMRGFNGRKGKGTRRDVTACI